MVGWILRYSLVLPTRVHAWYYRPGHRTAEELIGPVRKIISVFFNKHIAKLSSKYFYCILIEKCYPQTWSKILFMHWITVNEGNNQ